MSQPHGKRGIAHAEVGKPGHTDEIVNTEVVDFAAADTLQDCQRMSLRQFIEQPDFIVRDLASEFEAPEPGGTEWIFTMRQGVKIAPNTLNIEERDLDSEDAMMS